MKKIFLPLLVLIVLIAQAQQPDSPTQSPETMSSLALQFVSPSDDFKPQTWWHWLGTNFSKEGMTKDLQAMKESGVSGVVIFNAPSWLDTEKNPWPHQTYRSEAYWDALKHALTEAKRLNMTVGLHNTPGWSTTGGPWISPEQGMQSVTFSVTKITGGKMVNIALPNPKENDETAKYFKDVAIIAVPTHNTPDPPGADDLPDLSEYFKDGILNWQAPGGEWSIYRFGYSPTMQRSHPAPEDVAESALEADKMNLEATVVHWNNVLNPLKERFAEYIGGTFKYIWIDSYEAWGQSWTPGFRNEFIRIKGYDPVKQVILAYERGDSILNERTHGLQQVNDRFAPESKYFLKDYIDVVNQLFLICWQKGKDMVNHAGFQLCFEPYGSIIEAPFDMEAGIGIADIPVTEFWVHSRSVSGARSFAEAAAKHGKRIVGAEAFTGMERTCTYTETPSMLKRPADMAYSQGVNLYFLHSWAHNPWDDIFQPGWGFAHYGTHFSRNQTWFEPGKAFFTYLARCQMLLQQGTFISRDGVILHRCTPEAEIFFVVNAGNPIEKEFEFPVTDRFPELWDAYRGTIGSTTRWKQENDKTLVTLHLEKDESMFVIFPARQTNYKKQPEIVVTKERPFGIEGKWDITFIPKTNEKPFKRTVGKLVDFSLQNDRAMKYFSGTAVYEKTIPVKVGDLTGNKRITIDLGELYDMAELQINGQKAGVLWVPPFRMDITPFIKAGNNTIKILITNTWVNRLIGDEQYPEDFEWTDKNQNLRAMKSLPEWFVNGQPRPVKERKAFTPWYYFHKDSPLKPAGLLGPVTLYYQDVQ